MRARTGESPFDIEHAIRIPRFLQIDVSRRVHSPSSLGKAQCQESFGAPGVFGGLNRARPVNRDVVAKDTAAGYNGDVSRL